jgi:hypothetical protein
MDTKTYDSLYKVFFLPEIRHTKKGKRVHWRCPRWSMLETDGPNDLNVEEVGQRES